MKQGEKLTEDKAREVSESMGFGMNYMNRAQGEWEWEKINR